MVTTTGQDPFLDAYLRMFTDLWFSVTGNIFFLPADGIRAGFRKDARHQKLNEGQSKKKVIFSVSHILTSEPFSIKLTNLFIPETRIFTLC